MIEHKQYTSLVTLFLEVMAGLTGTVVQAFDGQDHHYFVVERYTPEAFQKRYPNLSSFVKLGTAKGNVFKAKISYEGVYIDYHEFSQQGVRCQNCGFADSINFHNGVPADRANEIWNALIKHLKSECKNPIFNLVR